MGAEKAQRFAARDADRQTRAKLMEAGAHHLLGGCGRAFDLVGRAQPVARDDGKDQVLARIVDFCRPLEALQCEQPTMT